MMGGCYYHISDPRSQGAGQPAARSELLVHQELTSKSWHIAVSLLSKMVNVISGSAFSHLVVVIRKKSYKSSPYFRRESVGLS
jgi:hypothetical protein